MSTYAEQTQWRAIQAFLPQTYRIGEADLPTEEWWEPTGPNGHRVHLDTYRNPAAPLKVILLHGVGTNGRQMSTILGRPLANLGYETIAIDMPGYGLTEVARGALVTYEDWIQLGSQLIDVERAKDDRPIVLYGLSAGGMETYHIAAVNNKVAGIVGMTFLDQRSLRVRRDTAFDPVSGLLGGVLMKGLSETSLRNLRLPMRFMTKMRALVNNKEAKKACYADRTSAGNSVTVAFLNSYLNYISATEPADFDVCPILLTQPAADRWTPLHLSEPFLNKITKVRVQTVMLDNAGHYPLEQPGLEQMVGAIAKFCSERTSHDSPPSSIQTDQERNQH